MIDIAKFRSGASFGIGIVAVLLVTGFCFATYSWLTASSGENLTYSKWNELLQYTVPPGTVVMFNGTSCPTNWTEAAGGSVTAWAGGSGSLDLRGEFVRGWDHGKGIDSGRNLGEWQKGSHFQGLSSDSYVRQYDVAASADMGYDTMQLPSYISVNRTEISGGRYTAASYPTTSYWFYAVRPRNVALIFCVKN